jgi:hypothetical protein
MELDLLKKAPRLHVLRQPQMHQVGRQGVFALRLLAADCAGADVDRGELDGEEVEATLTA